MGLLLGLIRREFAIRPRRRFFYWRRFGLIAPFLAWAGYQYLLNAPASRAATGGLVLFSSLMQVVILAVLLLAPFIAGDLLMREKEERTLGLLYLTAITPTQLMAAKLFTALLTSGALALGVLPLFVLSVSLGGIATEQILLAFLLLACTIFAATALGLWAGTRACNGQDLGVLLVTLVLVIGLGLPAGFAFINGQTDWLAALDFWPEKRWLAVLSPYLAMTQIASGLDLRGPWWACLGYLAFGLLFLALAARALPRRLTDEPAAAGALLPRRRGRQATHLHGRYPQLMGNPVFWRDYYVRYGGSPWVWGHFVIVAATIAWVTALAWMAVASEHMDSGDYAVTYFWTMVGLGVVIGGLGYIVSHARCLNSERASRALDLLLTTDLEPREILGGKQRAILLAFVPWALMALAGAVVAAWQQWSRADAWRKVLGLCMAICFAVATAYGFAAVGLHFALRLPRFATAATLAALVAGIALQLAATQLVIALLVAAQFVSDDRWPSPIMWALTALGATTTLLLPPVVLGLLLRRRISRHFRRLAANLPL